MLTVTRNDKDLLLAILSIAIMLGGLFVLIKFLGELHGTISFAVVLIGQVAFLARRVGVLERELQTTRRQSGSEQLGQVSA
jgi:hypothetical protein